MLRIGFVVNPIAGMGGPVGLKGTDGEEVLEEAISRGAERRAGERAQQALSTVRGSDYVFLTCEGEMGEDALTGAGIPCEVACRHHESTSGDDTRAAVRTFLTRGVDLVVFVGGDGTARDVLAEAGDGVPMLGVPSGVKMHSAVFLNSPQDLGELLRTYERSKAVKEAEVMDVDEESFRRGDVRAKLYGIARTPDDSEHMQAGKQSYTSGTAGEEAEEIGHYVAESMEPGRTYIIGPGSTTAKVARALGQPKTLLGVDVYRDGRLVTADASEEDLLTELREGGKAAIVVSPIGAQGFFFGRGNQQISPAVIRAVGLENLTVISTPSKLRSTSALRVDTGDSELDRQVRGSIKVVTGYKRRRLVKVA